MSASVCECHDWSMIQWTPQPDGAQDAMSCMECDKTVDVGKDNERELIEHKITVAAADHPAFDHMGHGAGIDHCREVARRCDGDFRWETINAVMAGMVSAPETAEERAARHAWNQRALAELARDLACLTAGSTARGCAP